MHHRIVKDDADGCCTASFLAMICARPIKGNHVLRTPTVSFARVERLFITQRPLNTSRSPRISSKTRPLRISRSQHLSYRCSLLRCSNDTFRDRCRRAVEKVDWQPRRLLGSRIDSLDNHRFRQVRHLLSPSSWETVFWNAASTVCLEAATSSFCIFSKQSKYWVRL